MQKGRKVTKKYGGGKLEKISSGQESEKKLFWAIRAFSFSRIGVVR